MFFLAISLSALLADTVQQPPIEVQSCTTGIESSDMLLKTDGNYSIKFVDRDERTADIVRFVVYLGQQQIAIRDVGKFSPGVAVTHRFPNLGGEIVLVGSPSISCQVKWVHFTDGTEWTPPPPKDETATTPA
jgi:hypothetical protein